MFGQGENPRAAIARAAVRPRPCPPVSRPRDGSIRKNGSNTACNLSSAMPGPSSRITIRRLSPATDAVTEVATFLAQALVRDGEGATKFITIRVEGGMNESECRKVCYAIAHSPLVKTAFFASDPNLGRILAAIGYAGIDDLDVSKVDLFLDNVLVAQGGGRASSYREEDGQRVMKQAEITVRVVLHRGSSNATVWTCDLSQEYVRINADYRS